MKPLLILMLSLLTCSATFAAEPDCAKDDCAQYIRKGAVAPYDGILLSLPASNAANVKLKVNQYLLDEAARYCDKRVSIEATNGQNLVLVEQGAARAREAVLLQGIQDEKDRSEALRAAGNDAEWKQLLWGAGGIGIGVLVGVVATAAVGTYIALSAP